MGRSVTNGVSSTPRPNRDVRPKHHPDRAALAGTIDDAFIDGDAWLPADFDFAFWNAAWPDQQVDRLHGDEVIELTNLCAPDVPALSRDAQGNGVLRLTLPAFQPYLLLRFEVGQLAPVPLAIDTLIVEPDGTRLIAVFRALIAKTPAVCCMELCQQAVASRSGSR